MNHEINRLLNFAQQQGLLDQADRVYGANLLLAALQLEEFSPEEIDERLEVPDEILGRMLDYAASAGLTIAIPGIVRIVPISSRH